MSYHTAVTRFGLVSRNLWRRGVLSRVAHTLRRSIGTHVDDFKVKYAAKLQERAKESGMNVQELVEQTRSLESERRKAEAQLLRKTLPLAKMPAGSEAPTKPDTGVGQPIISERKDSSPIKPLSDILNLPRIMATPHTAEQVSALWTAYHASRSAGTGRGYICATIPLDLHRRMQSIGEKFSSFIVPLPRTQATCTPEGSQQEGIAYEFFFLQWAFHPPPPIPSASNDPFQPSSVPSGSNPATATVLFTPLEEYKLRGSSATPYLILTMYTDLASTHGVVLLRGEITPSSSGTAGNYMLSQNDAHLLALNLQKFYLWTHKKETEDVPTGQRLLQAFHEKPQEFDWKELLEYMKATL